MRDDVERVGPQEVDADRDQVALGLRRLFLESQDPSRIVKLGDAEALRIADRIKQRSGSPRTVVKFVARVRQRAAAQDVVAQHDAEAVVRYEVPRQADGVRDPKGTALVSVRQIDAEVVAVREQLDDV